MRGRVRLVVFASGVAVANIVACASIDLMPIQDPPGSNVDSGRVGAGDANAGEPSAVDAGTADGGNTPCKRGIALGGSAGPPAALASTASTPGVWWSYNWGTSQNPPGDPRIEYVPMLWGSGSLGKAIPVGSKYLLGFNEPNFNSQANLPAQQAAAAWPMVEARANGIPIVSPAVNFCGSACSDPTVTDPYTYLSQFLAACSGCKVDYIAVHAYYCDVQSLRDYLEGNMATGGTLAGFVQFGRPIWVTEFACGPRRNPDGGAPIASSVAEQKAYMQAAVPYLESNPNVMRYAWFSATPIPNVELVNTDGSLTDLGATYVALPQSCH
jgi:hypothetical protein